MLHSLICYCFFSPHAVTKCRVWRNKVYVLFWSDTKREVIVCATCNWCLKNSFSVSHNASRFLMKHKWLHRADRCLCVLRFKSVFHFSEIFVSQKYQPLNLNCGHVSVLTAWRVSWVLTMLMNMTLIPRNTPVKSTLPTHNADWSKGCSPKHAM